MRILHISDLHFGNESSKTAQNTRKNCLEKLENVISQISKEKSIDYLIVSGDIAYHGKENEYNVA